MTGPGDRGYRIRALAAEDGPALAAAYDRNREHLAPWDPVRPASFYTADGQRPLVEEQLALIAALRMQVWLVEHDTQVVGRLALNNIVWGSLRSGALGYWVDHAHIRRGVASWGVEHVCAEAFATGLHRVEAGTMVANTASQAVLRRCGFTRFGTAQRFLFLAGAWQDHHLYQRILHDDPLP